MKIVLAIFLAFTFANVSAQHVGKQYEWLKLAPEQLPVKSGEPYYDISVNMDDDAYSREVLDANAGYYFGNVFGSSIVRNEGKHKFSGVGSYSFSIRKSTDPVDIYTVNYVLDISTKNGKYNIAMHSFTLTHLDLEVNIERRIEAAEKNDITSKQLLASIHKNNLNELKKAYTTMQRDVTAEATASK